MINTELKIKICKNFFKSYKNFLKDYIYKKDDAVKKVFKDKTSVAAFDLVVCDYLDACIKFYEINPNGTYIEKHKYLCEDATLKKSLEMYGELVNDDRLFSYLQIYIYCVEELSYLLYDRNGDLKDEISVYTNNGLEVHKLEVYLSEVINSFSKEMYRRVSRDIKSGNYWWLKNTATTLRRQLFDNFAYVNTSRFKLMCKKYLEMDMTDQDIQDKLTKATNGGIKLGEQLDKKMLEKYNAKPYHCWWEITDSGSKILHLADYPPQKGVYTYIAYHTNLEENKDQRDSYFF